MAFVIDSQGKVHRQSFVEYMQARLDALTDDAPAASGKRAVAARHFEAQHGRRPAVVKVEAPELVACSAEAPASDVETGLGKVLEAAGYKPVLSYRPRFRAETLLERIVATTARQSGR